MLLNHLKVKVGYYFERLHPYMPHHCLGVKERRWDLTPGILDMVCQESAEDSTTSQVTFPHLQTCLQVTALYLACKLGQVEMALLLTNAGADPDIEYGSLQK